MFKSILACLSLFTSTLAISQAQVDTLAQRLIKHQLKFPLEKVYLHLDRPHYAPGDTLWFKAYLTEGDSHKPDSVSKNLYVDFIKKESGKVMEHLTLRNEGSYAAGTIAIADTLQEGVYEIIAYTQWMRNFSEAYFFHKDVFIRKKYELKNQPSEAEIAARMDVADLQFFPEGGNLVAGMQNRIAFKAVNKYGLGTDFKAFVISSHHDTVASIQTQHLGMGSFIFKPNAGEKYYAVIGKVSSKKFALPEPIASGYTFFVDNLSNKNLIKVIARNNLPEKDRPILIGHLRGNQVIAFQSKTEGNAFTWALPKSTIKENGIVQLTLFNGKGVPQCERLIYNKAEAPMSVSILTHKSEYDAREKVTLSIHVQDTAGNPLEGNFSLSVTDARQVTPDINGTNIYNYFYLTSDVQSLSTGEVKGTIEQPDYYFTSSDLNAVVHLDMLLLTQGWRKFLWSEIVEGKENPTSFEIEQAITVKGKALLFSGKPISKPASISLMYVNLLGDTEYLNTKTENNGRFAFNLPEVKENTQVFIQGQKEKGGRNLKFELENKGLPKYKTTPQLIDPFFFDSQRWNLFLEQQARLADMDAKLRQVKAKILKEVVITRKREEIKPDSRKAYYQGSNATTLKIENTMCSGISNVLQMLQSRVAGLQISLGRNGDYVASIRNKVPVILVDGMRYDISMISTVWPCDVESIDIVTSPVLMLNAPCLISILTKQANPNYDFSKDVAMGTLVTTLHGYKTPRKFYSPKYPVASSPDPLPDFRATLYWNPFIKTDAEGNARVTFWNSDEHTTVQAQLEGMTKGGKPGCATYNYTIK
jgi:hypothetical protein